MVNSVIKHDSSCVEEKNWMNFDPLTPEIMRLMFTYLKSTVRIWRMLMHLTSGHVTLLLTEFHHPEFFSQSDLRRQADSHRALSQISSIVTALLIFA